MSLVWFPSCTPDWHIDMLIRLTCVVSHLQEHLYCLTLFESDCCTAYRTWQVTAWTLRNEASYLAKQYKGNAANEYNLLFNVLGLQGGFTDHTRE
jgi:hypothetical protein